jgi:sulfatase-modifying factor enzyme 1
MKSIHRSFVVFLLLAGILGVMHTACSTPERPPTAPESPRSSAVPERVLPAFEEWIMSSSATQEFWARAESDDADIVRATWHVTGPRRQEKHARVLRDRSGTSSRFVFKPKKRAGEYTISCTFAGKTKPYKPASWSVTVDGRGYYTAHGRKVNPEELGTMILIKGARFTMGAPSVPSESHDSFLLGYDRGAKPAHDVQIDSFYIGKYPVTAVEFCRFLNDRGDPESKYCEVAKGCIRRDEGSGIYTPRGSSHYVPCVAATWFGAVEYCKWLSQRTGKPYRLPTEAEWELRRARDRRTPLSVGENGPDYEGQKQRPRSGQGIWCICFRFKMLAQCGLVPNS